MKMLTRALLLSIGLFALPAARGQTAGSPPPAPIADQTASGPACSISGPCCPGRECGGCERIYVVADGMVLSLDRPVRQSLVVNRDTQASLLATSDLGFDFQPGFRVGFGMFLDCGRAVEISYFGVDHWDASAAVAGDDNLRLAGQLGLVTDDFSAARQMTATYLAELHNAEINYFQPIRDTGMDFLGGFRYVNVTERFNLNAVGADLASSDYRVGSENNLFGGQIGARFRRQYQDFGWEFVGKAGYFGCDAKQRTLLRDDNNTLVLRNWRTDGGGSAFVGELALIGTARLTEHVYLRGGYNLIWIEGIARAADQLDFTDTATSGMDISDGGDAFLHGAIFGLEARW